MRDRVIRKVRRPSEGLTADSTLGFSSAAWLVAAWRRRVKFPSLATSRHPSHRLCACLTDGPSNTSSEPIEATARTPFREETMPFRSPGCLPPWQARASYGSNADHPFTLPRRPFVGRRLEVGFAMSRPRSLGNVSGWSSTFSPVADAWFGRPSMRLRVGIGFSRS